MGPTLCPDLLTLVKEVLINHSFDDLLSLCRPDAFVLLLGATTPLCPLLFESGIDALSGTRVIEPQMVLRSVSQGATFRQIKRVGGLRLLQRLLPRREARWATSRPRNSY